MREILLATHAYRDTQILDSTALRTGCWAECRAKSVAGSHHGRKTRAYKEDTLRTTRRIPDPTTQCRGVQADESRRICSWGQRESEINAMDHAADRWPPQALPSDLTVLGEANVARVLAE